jgi:uncharacterized protein (TIGR03086 family)
MELVSLFLSAQRAFGDRVHAVREDQWNAATPCRDWDVAALVGHLIDEDKWLPPLMHGLDLESAGKVVEGSRTLPVDGGVGANLAEVWDEASLACADAVRQEGALDRTVELSRGPTPARDYVGEMIFDHLVHAWDLGTAIGFTGPLPEDVVAAVYGMAQGMGDLSGFGDMFAPPVAVPEDASTLDKLIGLTGRNPG